MTSFSELEKKLAIDFKNKKLLEQAFIHRSYLNEHKQIDREHNERLEFLGDAVLELIVTDYLFNNYKDKQEGELTSYRSALVNSEMLASVASDLDFERYLLLSKGEAKDKGRARTYILANTIEAFIGALYIDQGYDYVREFVVKHLIPKLDKVLEERTWIDSKSLLQTKSQEVVGLTPSYKTIKENGPDHDKLFTVTVFFGPEKIASGEGKSKQDAEQDAARNALLEKGW